VSFVSLPLEKLPDIRLPKVTIETAYPGMGAAELRGSVTIPLEDSLSTVKGLEGIKSVSRDGASVITLSFRWGTDPSAASALAREVIDTVYPGLPQGVRKPAVISGDSGEDPHAIIAVRSKTGDMSFARTLAEYELKARFRRLEGTGTVILAGGETEEIRINADPEQLAVRGINFDELAGMIASETQDIPGGSAREGDRELTVVSAGRPLSVEELAALIIPSEKGSFSLKDLAETRRTKAPQKSLFIYQNEEQTGLEIYRRPGSDPVKLSRGIKKVLADASRDFSEDAEFSLVYDSSFSILQSITNLIVAAVLAAAAVAFVLALFMHRLRFSMLAALVLPLSAAAAFIALNLSGRSLNSMSLGGLALGIGLVSDVSVIVMDQLRSKTEKQKCSPERAGALVSSVSLSSLAGTLTTVVVFVPVIFLPGPLGALFGDLALALIVSIVTGWLYAQFCLPSLFLFLPERNYEWKNNRLVRKPQFLNKSNFSGKPEKIYRFILRWAIRKPLPLIAGALIFSGSGLVLVLSRPAEFIASSALEEINVSVEFPPGTLPEAAAVQGIAVSETLAGFGEVLNFFGKMGAEDEDLGRRADPDYHKEKLLFRCFLRKGTAPENVLEKIQRALSFPEWENMKIAASYPEDKIEKLLGLSSALGLAVRGNNREEIAFLVEEAAAGIKNAAGSALETISAKPSGTRPELRLFPDREAAARLGVSAAGMASSVFAATEGIITGTIEIEGRTVEIRSAGKNGGLNSVKIGTLPLSVSEAAGGPVFLGTLNRIEQREAESALARQDRSDVMYLDLVSVPGKEAELAAAIKKLPSGVYRADESVFARYRTSLAAAVVLVIVLLYFTLAAQFESFLLPFVLMLSIPFSLAGAGPLLLFTGSSLDFGSVLGLIVLFGLAVNNGIILYEASDEKLRSGQGIVTSVYSGAENRFRPALITSLTTVFALLPLVASGSSSQRSMAAAMLGGIAASTVLTFFVMPPVFIFLLRLRNRKQFLDGRHD
jgi:multidrug efflux pump subunit AcrB